MKSIEVFFRKLLVRALKLIVKRRRPLPPDIDFNQCKFLFVRQDRIGDVLISTPLYTLLKKRYPGAIVDFLLSSKNYFVLENDPLIRKKWIYTKTVWNAIGLILAIRREKYDFVVDLMDNPSTTSTFICLLAKGSWNAGLGKENAYIYDLSVPLPSRVNTHIVERTASLLNIFNIDPLKENISLHYHISKESQVFAEDFLKSKGLLEKSFIAINISPVNGNKYWGRENFSAFIGEVKKAYPSLAMLVLFQPSDRKEAEAVVRTLSGVILSPDTKSFDQFAAFIKRAAFLITPDTSAVHLAAAFQIPTVALYVQSNPEVRIWEPYGVDSETLVSRRNGLQTIPPKAVVQAFAKLYVRNRVRFPGFGEA